MKHSRFLQVKYDIGIKHAGFSCINICQVPWEMLKTEAGGRGFQHLPWDLANANALKKHVWSLSLHKKVKTFATFRIISCTILFRLFTDVLRTQFARTVLVLGPGSNHLVTEAIRRPRWLSWMRRPTGDQEVAGSTPAEVGNILSWRLIMNYFLRSFSPFRWFKKGNCQFLAKECAQYWLNA